MGIAWLGNPSVSPFGRRPIWAQEHRQRGIGQGRGKIPPPEAGFEALEWCVTPGLGGGECTSAVIAEGQEACKEQGKCLQWCLYARNPQTGVCDHVWTCVECSDDDKKSQNQVHEATS